jgi:hypothetical protein
MTTNIGNSNSILSLMNKIDLTTNNLAGQLSMIIHSCNKMMEIIFTKRRGNNRINVLRNKELRKRGGSDSCRICFPKSME